MSFSLSSGRPSLGGRSLAKAISTTKEVYSFPILEAEEIADVLREMGAAVTEEDFNKPKPDTFRTWCELFVIEILGINKDELYVTNAEFADALDGTEELHEASVPIIHFVRNMNKVLAAARCDEGFSLRDLMKPERVRVLRVLSALINLQKFKVEKLVWYTEQEGKKLEVLQRKEAIEVQQNDLKRRIDAERSLRDGEAPAIAAAHAQLRELESTRNEKSAALEELRASTKSMKEEVLAAREEAAALQARIQEARAALDASRAMIISSPEKVKAEVSSLEANVASAQADLDAAEANRRLIGRQLEVVAKAEKDVVKAMTLMGEAEAEAVKLKRIQKDEKGRKSEVEAVVAEVEALKVQLEHANSQRRRAEEKLTETRASTEARLSAQAKELEVIWREAAEYSDDMKASVDSRRAAEAEEMRLERRKEALISQHSSEVADMVSSLKRLSTSLSTYNNGVVSGLSRLDEPVRQGL